MLNPTKLVKDAYGLASGVAGGAVGIARRALGGTGSTPEPPPPTEKPAPRRKAARRKPAVTDTALARKVESQLFQADDAPKDSVSVNCVGRVVTLRGEVKTPDLIKELESRAAAIPEVQRVENLLHLPKTPSPTRTDTPEPQRKSVTTQGAPPSEQRRRMNAEKPVEGAEPSPRELAEQGSGRQPAPLGSQNSGENEES